MQMIQEINQRNQIGQYLAARQPRAATQGGYIFNGQHMHRGNAYAAVGSKLNKANMSKYSND